MKTKKRFLTIDEIKTRLLKAGVNPTPQRVAICKFVLCEADHPTADQVKEWVDRNTEPDSPKISLATVYNTLNALVAAGLLKELKLSHSEKVIYDDIVAFHYHFLDEKSGELHDVLPEQVEVKPSLEKIFSVEHIEVLLKGKVGTPN